MERLYRFKIYIDKFYGYRKNLSKFLITFNNKLFYFGNSHNLEFYEAIIQFNFNIETPVLYSPHYDLNSKIVQMLKVTDACLIRTLPNF